VVWPWVPMGESILHWKCHGDIRNVRLESGNVWAVYSVLIQMFHRFQYQGYVCIISAGCMCDICPLKNASVKEGTKIAY